MNFFLLFRNILFSVGACLFMLSCGDSKETRKTNEKKQQNVVVANMLYDAYRTGNVSKLDSILSDDFVDHSDARNQGKDSLILAIQLTTAHYGGLKTEIIHQVADSNYVFTWLRYAVSNRDINAENSRNDMQSIGVALFRDGKIIEHWEFANVQDMVELAQQKTGSGAPVDTTAR